MKEEQIKKAYEVAKSRYASLGKNTDQVIETQQSINLDSLLARR